MKAIICKAILLLLTYAKDGSEDGWSSELGKRERGREMQKGV